MSGWRLEHTYTLLPPLFFSDAAPGPVREPHMAVFNEALARTLGLDPAIGETPDAAAIFSGNTLPEGVRLARQTTTPAAIARLTASI